jgi:FKBP-type peptidyl-prolyl cis-trans isomerase 2
LEVWSELPTQQWVFKIIAIDDKTVTIDVNPPLAGKKLFFDIEVKDIK